MLVSVRATQGSVPREAGTWMAVFAERLLGTIGGGHIEHEAIALARAALKGDALPPEKRFALGPSLGQCCGGVMHLGFERVQAGQGGVVRARLAAEQDARRMPVGPSMDLLRLLHERWVLWLRSLDEAAFARTAVHPDHGPMRVDDFLQLYAWHGRHHTAHVTGMRKRMGW